MTMIWMLYSMFKCISQLVISLSIRCFPMHVHFQRPLSLTNMFTMTTVNPTPPSSPLTHHLTVPTSLPVPLLSSSAFLSSTVLYPSSATLLPLSPLLLFNLPFHHHHHHHHHSHSRNHPVVSKQFQSPLH